LLDNAFEMVTAAGNIENQMKEEVESMTNGTLSHDWQEETIEAKARWFQSLSLAERMDLLCWFTDLILTTNPRIMEQKDAQPIEGRIRVLTAT
jgi:hypothetical protein